MLTLDPLQWLLAGLAFMLLVLLCLITSRRWKRAQHSARLYRTANGLDIERQSRRVLHQSQATRRVRAGPLPPGHLTAVQRADRIESHFVNYEQVRNRAAAAALFDMGHGGIRRAGPYTLGSTEHQEWRRAYDAVFIEKPPLDGTVQTTAQQPEAVAA